MKILIKQIAVALATLGLLASPLFALAANEKSTAASNTGFCSGVSNIGSQLNAKLTQLETERGQNQTGILAQLKQRQDQRDQDEQKLRDNAKTRFEDDTSQIEASATTDAEKAAVATFKSTVESAMTTRKAAVDAAMQTFKTAQQQLVGTRQDAIKTAVTAYKNAVAAAITKAQLDCTAHVASATVRQTFLSNLKTARTTFQEAIQGLDKIGQQMKILAQTRNEAVRAANQAFKATVEQARQTLKAAFPNA
ncbi:MAG TPA: hypothetical protein VGQ87_01330 [Patescibacteria group bacterium]|jgi:hypothetical protein|nr:hypothetical protein [Patescibacteria group bacterium]